MYSQFNRNSSCQHCPISANISIAFRTLLLRTKDFEFRGYMRLAVKDGSVLVPTIPTLVITSLIHGLRQLSQLPEPLTEHLRNPTSGQGLRRRLEMANMLMSRRGTG